MEAPEFTLQIAMVLGVVAVVVVLFITEWLRCDLVAIMVMVALPLLGLVDGRETFQGLSSTAVISIIALISPDIRGLFTVLTLIGAGLAIALREALLSIAGWIRIAVISPYRIGDRVQIGPVADHRSPARHHLDRQLGHPLVLGVIERRALAGRAHQDSVCRHQLPGPSSRRCA